MLSIKGREPFIRMHLWLNDPQNVEKLQAIKEERDNLKRKRQLEPPGSLDDSNPSSPAPELADPYSASVGSPGSAKKARIQFNDKQKEALKVAFSLDPYPSPSAIDFLGQELGLEPRTIINWFHNHRMRLKQQQESGGGSESGDEPAKPSFDPLHFRLMVNQRLLGLGDPSLAGRSSPPEDAKSEGLDLSGQHGEDSAEEDSSRQSLDSTHASRGGGGRSRRKPLAPQWVNPVGPSPAAAAAASVEDEEVVNGKEQDVEVDGDDVGEAAAAGGGEQVE